MVRVGVRVKGKVRVGVSVRLRLMIRAEFGRIKRASVFFRHLPILT